MKILLILLGIAAGLAALVSVAGMVWAWTARRPGNLGIHERRLAPAPETPNCVATQSGNAEQRMDPMPYEGGRAAAQKKLLAVLKAMPRTKVLVNEPGYVWVVCRTAFFRFPDDVEFAFDDDRKVIDFRAAARLGTSDFGVNRARMEKIRQAFEKQAR